MYDARTNEQCSRDRTVYFTFYTINHVDYYYYIIFKIIHIRYAADGLGH